MSSANGLASSNVILGGDGLSDDSFSGTSFMKFVAPTGTDTAIVRGTLTTIATRHQCITGMLGYSDKSLEELRMEDYAANRKGGGTCTSLENTISFGGSALIPIPSPVTSNINQPKPTILVVKSTPGKDGSSDATLSGTAIKFEAPVGRDTMLVGCLLAPITTRHQCITAMKIYENKSFEELRMEDYAVNRKGGSSASQFGSESSNPTSQLSLGNTTRATLFGSRSTNPTVLVGSGSTNPAVLVGSGNTTHATLFGSGSTNPAVLVGSRSTNPAVLVGSRNTSSAFRFGIGSSFPASQIGLGTTISFGVPFSITRTQSKPSVAFKVTRNGVGDELTITSKNTGSSTKFSAPTGTDTMMRAGLSQTIGIRMQCICCMKEYEDKSLEELRMEDYAANRKGCKGVKAAIQTRDELTIIPLPRKPTTVNKQVIQKRSNSEDQVENVKENFRNLLEDELICNICTELLIKPTTLGCSHTFCKYCITEWKEKKHQCPLCRTWIASETPCLSLENFINKAVKQLNPENLEKRLEIIRCREQLLRK